jgi:hypothetical protein
MKKAISSRDSPAYKNLRPNKLLNPPSSTKHPLRAPSFRKFYKIKRFKEKKN